MAPTTSSLKTHAGDQREQHPRSQLQQQGQEEQKQRQNNDGNHSSTDFKCERDRRVGYGLATPNSVQQSSERDNDSSPIPTNIKRGQTEVEVIREWFLNIFQPVEKTVDIVITDFKFSQVTRSSSSSSSSSSKPTNSSSNLAGRRNVFGNNCNGDGISPDNSPNTKPFQVLKRADVDMRVGGKTKTYSVVIKVLPTDDPDRHSDPAKFASTLKFAKEVQVYQNVLRSMAIFDEKRYPSACVEPPVPKCFLSQLDAQNDVLVIEDLYSEQNGGFRHYPKEQLADLDHCRVVLRRLAHFHAISTLIQRDAEMGLLDLYPFAVDGAAFQQRFRTHVNRVKEELTKYLLCSGKRGLGGDVGTKEKADSIIEKHLEELFWKLVELRALPHNDRRLSVLVHGKLDLCNVVFQYDDASGRPICAKFLDFSTLTVSSPVIDLSYFLHRSVLPEFARSHHAVLIQHYLRSHTEAIKSFGMHGFEMEMDTLLEEYRAKQDYGAMMACMLKPALYVLQCINLAKPNDANNGKQKKTDKSDNEEDEDDDVKFSPTVSSDRLKIDRDLVPVDLRLHSYLSALAKACPCACSVGGSRELMISELSSDSLEDLRTPGGSRHHQHQLGLLDCGGGNGGAGGGGGANSFKKLILGLISSPSSREEDSVSGSGFASSSANGGSSKKIKEISESGARKV